MIVLVFIFLYPDDDGDGSTTVDVGLLIMPLLEEEIPAGRAARF